MFRMITAASLAAMILSAVSCPAPLVAQEGSAPGFPGNQRHELILDAPGSLTEREVARPPIAVAGGGLLGAAVGAATGAFLGWHMGGGGELRGDDARGFPAGLVGGLVGGTIGAPLGAHVTNGRCGNFALGVLGSALAVVPAALLNSYLTTESADFPWLVVAVPVTQGAAAALVEWWTSSAPDPIL